ncbi:MAG TPA: GxxExxY protein [Candidatus Dormibacteraeota bacterium]|nr:GxxExxY protein [Candidatus Dormibacteraeota bacterium]
MDATQRSINQISERVIGGAIQVHRHLGPGLLESTYEACLVWELQRRGLGVATQVPLPIVYGGVRLAIGYRLDLVVEDTLIVEIKAVDVVLPVHKAQLLSYLRLSGKSVGLLLNFNVTRLKDGLTRVVNQF